MAARRGRRRLPVVQALHTSDAAEAFRLATTGSVRGAFNIAADPVLTTVELARVLRARTAPLPSGALVAGTRLAFRSRLIPAPP